MRAVESEICVDARRARWCWPRPAAAFWAASTRASSTSASRRTRSASSRSAGSGARLLHGDPLEAFRGNYTQRDVMQEVRSSLRKFRDLRTAVRNYPSFNIGGGNFDIDFVLRGPELRALCCSTPSSCATRSQELGHHRRRHHAEARTSPSCASRSIASAPPTWASTPHDIATRSAPDGRRRPRGLALPRSESANEDYDVQLRLTEGDRNDPRRSSSSCYVPRRSGGLVQPRQPRPASSRQQPVAHRPARPPAPGAACARVAPGYASADRLEALRGRRPR